MRVLYSTMVTMDEVERAAPNGYVRCGDGDDKRPGTFGPGFGGEPVVVLLNNDDGAWFKVLVAGKKAR